MPRDLGDFEKRLPDLSNAIIREPNETIRAALVMNYEEIAKALLAEVKRLRVGIRAIATADPAQLRAILQMQQTLEDYRSQTGFISTPVPPTKDPPKE